MGLPEEVQTWVHKYYYYLWTHRKGSIIAGLLDDLPFALHSEISAACYKPLMKKVRFVLMCTLVCSAMYDPYSTKIKSKAWTVETMSIQCFVFSFRQPCFMIPEMASKELCHLNSTPTHTVLDKFWQSLEKSIKMHTTLNMEWYRYI